MLVIDGLFEAVNKRLDRAWIPQPPQDMRWHNDKRPSGRWPNIRRVAERSRTSMVSIAMAVAGVAISIIVTIVFVAVVLSNISIAIIVSMIVVTIIVADISVSVSVSVSVSRVTKWRPVIEFGSTDDRRVKCKICRGN